MQAPPMRTTTGLPTEAILIFNNMLKEYSFPNEIFSGRPERISALKELLRETGRAER